MMYAVPTSQTLQPRAPRHLAGATAVRSTSLDEAYELRLLGEVARWDDQAAFEEIYTHHRAAVMRVALQVCHDRSVAEEIVSQTFTALWVRAARLFEKSLRLRPWLTTVARNAAIDHVRAQRHVELEPWIAEQSVSPAPEEQALAREMSAELAQAIATLPPAQRAAIELVYFADMTYRAAAAALDEPVGTIKSRVRLAHGHLRAALERRIG